MQQTEEQALVVEFARMGPAAVLDLIAVHREADGGHCAGCPRGGYGTPSGRWPCLLRVLAEKAAALHSRSTVHARAAA